MHVCPIACAIVISVKENITSDYSMQNADNLRQITCNIKFFGIKSTFVFFIKNKNKPIILFKTANVLPLAIYDFF